jgi:hypothetical protein
MGVDGLTRENVASHLQKFRLQQKKQQLSPDSNPNSPQSPSDYTPFMINFNFSPSNPYDVQVPAAHPMGFTPQSQLLYNTALLQNLLKLSSVMQNEQTPQPFGIDLNPVSYPGLLLQNLLALQQLQPLLMNPVVVNNVPLPSFGSQVCPEPKPEIPAMVSATKPEASNILNDFLESDLNTFYNGSETSSDDWTDSNEENYL